MTTDRVGGEFEEEMQLKLAVVGFQTKYHKWEGALHQGSVSRSQILTGPDFGRSLCLVIMGRSRSIMIAKVR